MSLAHIDIKRAARANLFDNEYKLLSSINYLSLEISNLGLARNNLYHFFVLITCIIEELIICPQGIARSLPVHIRALGDSPINPPCWLNLILVLKLT